MLNTTPSSSPRIAFIATIASMGLAALAACGSATQMVAVEPPQRPLDPAACPLDAYAPATVQPHYDDAVILKTTVHQLHGADVFIPAQPGLTVEWLRHQLQPVSAAGCALGVPDAEISVASAGPGFLVTIRARHEDAGREIFRLARVTDAQHIASATR